MRIYLTGAWYSSRNAGDQAILITIRDLLAEALPEAELEVICARADFVRAEHGMLAVSQMRELPRVLWRVFRSDGLFIGGGTPFYDDFTHLAYFWLLAFLCKAGGGKLVIYGASTQALKTGYGRFFTRAIMNMADLVTVREPVTAARLPAMGVRTTVHCTADPAITLTPVDDARVDAILSAEGIDPARPIFAICPHFFSNTDPYRVHHYEQFDDDPIIRQETVLASLADWLSERGQVVFLPMNIDLPDSDVVVQRAIAARMQDAGKAILVETQYRPREIAGLFARCQLVVGVRLHALIMAAAVDTPIIAIDYAPKVRGFMQLLGEESHCHELKTLQFEPLRDGVEAYLADYDAQAAALRAHAAVLRARARGNAAMATALLRGRGEGE